MIDFSLLIPTHNRATLLGETLESLKHLAIPAGVQIELIVIANGCTDETVQVAQRAFANLKFPCRVVEEMELGLSAARNRGLAEAQAELCAYLDDDLIVSPGWLEAMLEPFTKHNADFATGRVLLWWRDVERPEWFLPPLESFLSCRDLGDRLIPLTDPGMMMGGNMAFKKKLVHDLGGFRTDLGRTGTQLLAAEETELCARAFAKGAKAYYVPGGMVQHYVAPVRVGREYLLKAAHGRGVSHTLANPTNSLYRTLRRRAGSYWLIVSNSTKAYFARLQGKKGPELVYQTRVEVGRGVLAAMAKR